MLGPISFILWLVAAPAGEVDLPKQIESLEAQLAASPEDVDARVNLALALSWSGDTKRSREEALEVVARAPRYWEAHLLLARLDAWEHKYDDAKQRLRTILDAEPNHRDAKRQLAEVELWSGDLEAAKTGIVALLESEKNPELYLKLAQVELDRLHAFASWQAVSEALQLDPASAKARALRDEIRLMSFDLSLAVEVLPEDEVGHGELVEVAFLPRSFLGVAVFEEFRRRFRTNNNRLGARVEWRIDKVTELDVSGAFGAPAEVVPELTAGLRFYRELLSRIDAAASYTFDRLPIDATLHRLRAELGVRFIEMFRAEASYTLGLFDDQFPGLEAVHAALLRGCYQHPRVTACVAYGAGSEVTDQIIFDAAGVSPVSLTTHNFALELRAEMAKKFEVRLSAELGARTNGTQIFTTTFGVKTWF